MNYSVFDYLWKAFNVILFFVLVWKFFGPKLKEEFNKAYQSISKDIENAKQKLEENKKLLEKANIELQNSKKKYEDILNFNKKVADEEKQEIITHAKEISKRVLERGRENIEREYLKAKSELIHFSGSYVINKAREKLQNIFSTPEKNMFYIEKVIEKIEKEGT